MPLSTSSEPVKYGPHSILRKGLASLKDLKDGNGSFGYPGDYPGRIYYVNNITGLSTNDGLSWQYPFAEVSQAITASEAWRQAYVLTTNDYIRNIIYIQGTETKYAYLTALPNYCDVIGIGADPRGNGSGIVIIGSDGAFDGATGTMRGTRWYNIQFCTGNGATSAFHATVAYRSWFENCTFGTTSTATAAPLSGLDVDSGSGLVVKNCAIVANASFPVTGFDFGGGDPNNFSQCLIEDNVVYGSTTGIDNSGYLCDITVFRNNTVYGGTTGILDDSAETTIGGQAFYVGNYVSGGTRAFNITNNGNKRAIGNWVINATLANFETEPLFTGATVGYSG